MLLPPHYCGYPTLSLSVDQTSDAALMMSFAEMNDDLPFDHDEALILDDELQERTASAYSWDTTSVLFDKYYNP